MSTSSKCPFQGHDLISLPERLGSVLSFLDSSKLFVFFKKPSWEESPPSILPKKAVTCFERKEIGRLVHALCVC